MRREEKEENYVKEVRDGNGFRHKREREDRGRIILLLTRAYTCARVDDREKEKGRRNLPHSLTRARMCGGEK